MKHQIYYNKNDIIRYVASIGDLMMLNFLMLAVYFLMSRFQTLDIELTKYMVIANLCYVPGVSVFKVVLYRRIVHPELIVMRLFGLVIVHFLLLFTVLALLDDISISHGYLLWLYISLFFGLVVWRLLLRQLLKYYRSHGRNIRKVVLIGDGDSMEELAIKFKVAAYGYQVMRMFKEEEAFEMLDWLKSNKVSEVYCGISTAHQHQVFSIIHYCENNMIRFYSVPSMHNYLKRHLELTLVDDVPVLSLGREPLQYFPNRLLKRAFDLVVSGLFLCTLFPIIYLIVGITIKMTSPGPILFRQKRTGLDGKEFLCYKFRSMRVNGDSDTMQATLNDPRKTKFGNFLRKSNLDELPQFINVFLGNMSLVGPRPHMLKHTEEYSRLIHKYMMRHLVKPGITGWAQITGFRGETRELSQMEGRVRRDIWYIENWTFLLDIRIMILTVVNMFKGEKNAY